MRMENVSGSGKPFALDARTGAAPGDRAPPPDNQIRGRFRNGGYRITRDGSLFREGGGNADGECEREWSPFTRCSLLSVGLR
jgi:hypothetical protein